MTGPADTLREPLEARIFQAGGGLREGSFYARRRADDDLLAAMVAGETCNGLAPRQIGKTSLALRTADRLGRRGFRCAMVDLNALGAQTVDVDGWYYGLCYEIQHQLGLDMAADLDRFWDEHARLGSVHRWIRFLVERVQPSAGGRVALFLDEIDAVLSLPFSRDDFFAAIRAVHDRPDIQTQGRTLVFCLLGVAVARDLVESESRTPFNVGRTIRIDDFTRGEMDAFAPGLGGLGDPPDAWLDEVYRWTDGNPYMVQRLLARLVDERADAERPDRPGSWKAADRVEQLAHRLFVQHGRTTEANLADAEKRIDRDPDPGQRAQMLQVYRRLLLGDRVPSVPGDLVQLRLRLSGLVAERIDDRGTHLAVRNRVFGQVFDLDWVRGKEAARLLTDRMVQWMVAGRPRDRLLEGTDLLEARAWAEGNQDRVSADEWNFLNTCQAAELERERSLRQGDRMRAQRKLLVLALLAALVLAGAFVAAAANAGRARRALGRLEQLGRTEEQAQAAAAGATEQARLAREELEQTRGETEGVLGELSRVGEDLARTLGELEERRLELADARAVMAESESLRERAAAEADLAWSLVEAASADRARRVSTLAGTPGRETDALLAALDSAAFDLRHADRVSPAVLSAMGDALRAVRRSVPLRGHVRAVTRATWSPDGSKVATAGLDGHAILWDAGTGEALETRDPALGPLRGAVFAGGRTLALIGDAPELVLLDTGGTTERRVALPAAPACMAPSPAGDMLALCLPSAELLVVDLLAGAATTRQPLPAPAAAAAFGQDGRLLVVTRRGEPIRWSRAGGVERLAGSGDPTDVPTSVAIAPKGGLFASGRADGTLWIAGPGVEARQVAVGPQPVDFLRFSDDGTLLLAGLRDGLLATLQTAGTGKPRVLSGQSGVPTAAAFARGMPLMATADPDGSVLLWTTGGELLRRARGHAGPVTDLAFQPDGAGFVSSSEDGTARIWDPLDSREVVAALPSGRWLGLHASPLGDRVVAVSEAGQAVQATAGTRPPIPPLGPQIPFVVDAAISGDGRLTAETGQDGTVLLDQTGVIAARVEHPGALGLICAFATASPLLAVGLSDGRVLVAGSGDGRPAAVLGTGDDAVDAVAWAPGDAMLAIGTGRDVELFEPGTWRLAARIEAGAPVSELRFAGPDRIAVLAAGASALVDPGGRRLAALDDRGAAARALAVGPAGTVVAVGRSDGGIVLVQAADGTASGLLLGHEGGVSGLAFSPDGTRLASAGADSSVRLWDWRAGRQLATLGHHRGGAAAVAFVADGEQVMSAGADGTVRSFDVGVRSLVASACDLAPHTEAGGESADTCAGLLRRVEGM